MAKSTPEASRSMVSRELSSLAFNARVLHEANDVRNLLLDRFRFLGIVASNVDEFFGVRVGSIQGQIAAGLLDAGPDGRSPAEHLRSILASARILAEAQQQTWRQLVSELHEAGHTITSWEGLEPSERVQARERFAREILPVLTPLAVDASHPFPFVSTLGLSIAVVMEDEEAETSLFGRVKIPPILGRLIPIGANAFLPIEELIRNNLDLVFVGHKITNSTLFRVTRNADFEVSEGAADDLLAAVEEELRQRRFGHAVRLEIERGAPRDVVDLLLHELELDRDAIDEVAGVLSLGIALEVAALDIPSLRSPRWVPVVPARIADAAVAKDGGADLFALINEGDLLVHHPYESFDASVDRFFAQAAEDPNVLSIRSTLYRTGEASSIPAHLIKAAEAGKEVVVLVELKARFDEAANIAWGRKLEDAGAHVIYGMMGLKTHCKATLVVRREGGSVRRYAHLSTGNYNPKTARLYTDLGLFTANESIGADLGSLFNYLTGLAKHPAYGQLLVAPESLRSGLTARIEAAITSAAAGGRPSITAKVNALVDRQMIELLDHAAASGVEVDLIVRGMCGLLPDKKRHSGRLRIRSIVGELLEHSRIYRFAIDGSVEILAGSADLMDRNLDRRVEVLFPLLDPESQRRAELIIATLLADTRNSWILQPDGAWLRSEEINPAAPERSAFKELKLAASNAHEAA